MCVRQVSVCTQKALHSAKVTELSNKDNFGVVKVVDWPQLQHVLSTLGIKTETGRIIQNETCGMKI